jgi:hypothetical protein
MQGSGAQSLRSVATTATNEEATDAVKRGIDQMEEVRLDLAAIYARAEGGTVIEQELGECLTKIRAALARSRKALGEVAQLPLGMN